MEWIEVRGTMNSKCPKCGYHIQTEDAPDTPYCPRCLYGKPTTFNLDVDFFENHKVKALAETPDGQLKIIVWLKLLAYAGKLNDEGRIYEHKGETLNRGFLSRLCGVTETQIAEFLKEYKRLRMIRFDTDKTMRLVHWSKYQNGVAEAIKKGKETEQEKISPIPHSKEQVKERAKNIYSLEKDSLDLREKVEENDLIINYQETETIKAIIAYMNGRCSTHYRYNTPNTVKHIRARLHEGYTYNDFVKVIDSKYEEWNSNQFSRYLKPDTLFGSKFEGYLQYALNESHSSSYEVDDFIKAAQERSFTDK